MTQVIPYAMTRDYRKEWTVIDAIREIVQNCLDNKENRSTYTLTSEGGIQIKTEGYILPNSAFALGESLKGHNPIGGFGEGFKLALLVLEREGLDATIEFGGQKAIPRFIHDDLLDRETFAIELVCSTSPVDATEFSFNVPIELIPELKQKVNVFSDEPMPLPNTVDFIQEKPGQIFVNGLFVCEEQRFKYGYNFAPDRIRLGCDRQIANPLGLAWETSAVWAERLNASNADEVLQMMTEQQLDVQDIHYHISPSQAKRITEAFVARFGHVTIKQMGSSLGYGMSVGGGLYNTMRKSGYTRVANSWEETNTPYSFLKELLYRKKGRLSNKSIEAILEQAKAWKKK